MKNGLTVYIFKIYLNLLSELAGGNAVAMCPVVVSD